MDQLSKALTKKYPGWLYSRPPDISTVFVKKGILYWSDQPVPPDLVPLPPVNVEQKMCEFTVLPSELAIIHSIELRGSFLNADGIYTNLTPESAFSKLRWTLHTGSSNGGAFIQTQPKGFGVFSDQVQNGLRVFATLSVKLGNLAPLVVQPGQQVYLGVTALDHALVPMTWPLSTVLNATIAGYRLFFRPSAESR